MANQIARVVADLRAARARYRFAECPSDWFSCGARRSPATKIGLHARLRIIPRLRDDTLPFLAVHIGAVTVFAVGFVLAGCCFAWAASVERGHEHHL